DNESIGLFVIQACLVFEMDRWLRTSEESKQVLSDLRTWPASPGLCFGELCAGDDDLGPSAVGLSLSVARSVAGMVASAFQIPETFGGVDHLQVSPKPDPVFVKWRDGALDLLRSPRHVHRTFPTDPAAINTAGGRIRGHVREEAQR